MADSGVIGGRRHQQREKHKSVAQRGIQRPTRWRAHRAEHGEPYAPKREHQKAERNLDSDKSWKHVPGRTVITSAERMNDVGTSLDAFVNRIGEAPQVCAWHNASRVQNLNDGPAGGRVNV